RYDDVTATDFQEAAITVANVKSLFEGLPSQIRQEFNQDPASFLNFAQDPNNGQELSDRGLLIGNDGIDMHGSIVNSMTKMQYQTMLNEKSKIDSEPRSEAILDSPKD
ncbi:hypothetical protein OAU96_03985, partial [Planctomycetota bacterium]|nr:hypothetical protein [Planctomycetota bacterium]